MIASNGKRLVRQSTCPAVIASKEFIPFCIPPDKNSINGSFDEPGNNGPSRPSLSRRQTTASLGALNKDLYIVDQYENQDKGDSTSDGYFSSSISTSIFPPDNVGRAWFSLTYEEEKEKLLLSLFKARNLRRPQSQKHVCSKELQNLSVIEEDTHRRTPSFRLKRRLFAMSRRNSAGVKKETAAQDHSKSDMGLAQKKINTLVNIYLLPDKRVLGQAKCKKVDIDPVFADRFVFQLSSSELRSRSLRMIFIEIDHGGRHHVIGHVTKPLTSLSLSGDMRFEDLEKGRPQGQSNDSIDSIESQILLSLCYNAGLSRLTVVLLRIKFNVPSDVIEEIEQDISLKFNVCGKCTKEKKGKTIRRQVGKAGSTDIGYTEIAMNESFRFDLKQSEFEMANLTINVKTTVQNRETVKFVALGGRMFARGEALDHWIKMTSSNNQFVQSWHSLTSSLSEG